MEKHSRSPVFRPVLQTASLLAAAAGCVLLSLPYLQSHSFWVDEVYTHALLRKSWMGMLAETMADVHPPLYYILLRLFLCAFGESWLNYRLASLVPFLLLSLTAAFHFRRRLGYFPALLFLLLSGLMPHAMVYNAEVRMYSWALLFVTLCGYSLYLILEDGSRRAWALFTLMGLGAAYTHYYAFLSVCFLYLTLLIALLANHKSLKGWWICAGVSVAGYLPWLLPFLTTLGRTAGSFWLTAIPSLTETLQIVYSGHIAGMLLILLSLFSAVACLILAGHNRLTPQHWMVLGTLLMAAGTLAVGHMVSALVRPLFLSRYFYPCCGLIWLSLGIAVQELTENLGGKRLILLAAVLLLALDCFWKPYTAKRAELIEVNGMIDDSLRYVNERAAPGDLICSNVGYQLSSNGLVLYFAENPNLTVVEYGADWLQPEHSTFLFTPELGYLPEDVQAAIDSAGMTVADSRGVCLAGGFFTVYHIVPAAS
ncbi:MAG: glycosyltransferase family 39 protein [Gemmiger sp.]